ncbi:MAG TPA: DUF4270 domain-containing protein [Bacteroidales bacterium]|nr:DUF4270 domain-containing protein [Bacteroidales bacterium]
MIKKLSWLFAGIILVMVFNMAGCKQDDNDLGIDIQPPNDKLNVFSSDTATILAYSTLVDSVKTDETSVTLLGSLVDPVFGRSTASFYTQLRLSKTAYDFGSTPYPDSIVLTLDYDDIYGDTLAPMTIRVYEMSERIFIDSMYYSNHSVAYESDLLAEKTFTPDLSTDVIIGEDTLDPHLRINLGQFSFSLAEKLMNAPADSMASNASFINYFYGLYVTAEPATAGGSIVYFNLLSELSEMTLYYHNGEDDSLRFSYLINSNCARFSHFDHDYSLGSPEFKAQVIDGDTTLGKSVCYVQALGGVKTYIRFPNIKNYYNNGKIAVNEARFFLQAYEQNPELARAASLIMVKRNGDGSYSILNDQLDGDSYFGGFYDESKGGYWFRITSTVQELMRSDSTDYGYEIYLSGGSINSERVLLSGTNPQSPVDAEDRMNLVITYTTLN